jgi:hypothetical protein
MKYHLLGLIGTLMSLAAAGCGRSGPGESAGKPEPMAARHGREAQAKGPNDKVADDPLPRKIIYTASVDLLVDDIDQTDKDIRALVAQQKGAYVAKADMHGSPGSRRNSSLTVRVPVDQFDTFRQAVSKLGEVQRESLDSQDVTDQFYDLDARIKNNLAEEESLRKLLDRAAAGKLEDYLAVREKLRQVTAELDVQKGQLQRLDKLSALATFTLTLSERKSYVRPETPAFGTRISRSFGGSFDSLAAFGQGLVLVLVALVPWLPVVALSAVPAWLWLRRLRRGVVPAVVDVRPAIMNPPASAQSPPSVTGHG